MNLARRDFLRSSASVSLGFLGLQRALNAGPVTSNAGLLPDPAEILSLPEDFEYRLVALHGEKMNDGFLRPGLADGMAAFSGEDGKVILVCNHELNRKQTHLGPFGPKGQREKKIDPKLVANHTAEGKPFQGGTTTMVWDPKAGVLDRQYMSLFGIERPCAGGPTPWGSWVTCEEPENLTATNVERGLGYCYEVPAIANNRVVKPVALKAMGRFRHEAIAVDPRSGAVYETEDRDDGLLYRFLPKEPRKLRKGGRLQALAIKGKPSMDLRNWGPSPTLKPGESLEVEWVDLREIDSPKDDLRHRGFNENGAARFARGEGAWYGKEEVYFACTSGGSKKLGQIWRYRPSPAEGRAEESKSPGKLELFLEPNDQEILRNGDNVTIAPWGDLIICEDAGMGSRVLGVTPEGKVYAIAHNPYSKSEFAGACFAPNHSTLFVNVQFSGATYAINGPWEKLRA